MPDDERITDAKDLLQQVRQFGARLKDRRRFERKQLLWAATVEVRGQRFEGTIVDFSVGGARLKFDAPVAAGDELTLVLKQLDELGAKVVWQREGEAGLQFLLAPDEVAARVQEKLLADLGKDGGGRSAAAGSGRAAGAGRRLAVLAVAAILGLGALGGGSLLIASSFSHEEAPVLALNGGAVGQHSCDSLMEKLGGSTNELDFSLNVASAVQAKCLDIHHLGPSDSDPRGHMVQTTKVPLH
ncbi:MAG TPA: PilZ domain-containing protein [Stellaceae bacterium]|jgi:PilZ domain|nr:PilZ domain-containing protein [Stellaceae bacterium]